MNEQHVIQTRDAILERMTGFFRGRDEVLGLFVSGSLASGTADEYSDIDYRVVVRSDSFDRYTAEQRDYPRGWGDFICNNGGDQHTVSHFKPFNKVDIFYYRPEDLVPSPWYTLPVRILYDPERIIANLVQSSASLKFTATAAEVGNSISVAIGNLHEVYRRLKRDELVYAQTILNQVRASVIEADDALNGRAIQGGFGFSHFEQRGSPDVCEIIYRSYCPARSEAIRRTLCELAQLYRGQVMELHKAFDLNREPGTDLDAIDIILNECRGA